MFSNSSFQKSTIQRWKLCLVCGLLKMILDWWMWLRIENIFNETCWDLRWEFQTKECIFFISRKTRNYKRGWNAMHWWNGNRMISIIEKKNWTNNHFWSPLVSIFFKNINANFNEKYLLLLALALWAYQILFSSVCLLSSTNRNVIQFKTVCYTINLKWEKKVFSPNCLPRKNIECVWFDQALIEVLNCPSVRSMSNRFAGD